MEIDFDDTEIKRLAPGVHAAKGFADSARVAAERAVELASRAVQNGTFGVGGLLIHDSGKIVAEATNSVIRTGRVLDPTAHVERQLVDWYFWARRKGLALSANELTIVTSVDPCAMCAGAILRSGMKAVALALDRMSGVHGNSQPYQLPKDLWREAERKITLFAVGGRPHYEQLRCPEHLSDEVPQEMLMKAEQLFEDSVANAQSLVSETSISKSKVTNDLLSRGDVIRKMSGQYDPRLAIPHDTIDVNDPNVRKELVSLLADDACAILDDGGRILMTARSAEELSPARTSILELIRAYTQLRWDVSQQSKFNLPHPRDCTVLKSEPDQETAKLVLELGALGSFLEGPRQSGLRPFMGYIKSSGVKRVIDAINSLPPLYSKVIHLDAGCVFNK